MEEKRVRILAPWMPLYREQFFRRLIQLGSEDDICYEIYSGKPAFDATGRSDASSADDFFTPIRTREVKFKSRSILFHKLDQGWKKPDLIIAEHAIRNFVVYKWALWHRPARLALWGHGKTYTKPKTNFEEWLKTILVNRADWFFGYTQNGVESVINKGLKPQKATVVRNSTDTKYLKHLMNSVKSETVAEFKTENNIGVGPVGVFIGALDPSKRIDFLISSSVEVHHQLPDFELLIFGDGPELAKVLAAREKYSFIKYCGRADLETQALVSKFAKIILMPGRVGLIAVDSFTLGLPIITTSWPWHAPEIEYLVPNENSIICKDTIKDYASAVIGLLRDGDRLAALRRKCTEDSKLYSIEIMAQNFHQGVKSALALSKIRNIP
jgi:glycosyltransferase involved in cell wall biosynthesis